MAYKKSRGRLVADLFGKSRLFDYDSTRSQEIVVDTARSGSVANSYLTSTYLSNTSFQSALANTNAYIASVSATERSALANTNAYIASVSAAAGSGDVSNSYLTSTYTSNAVFQSFVANTNAYIASSGGGGSSATTFVEYTYTATASQQSFSGADDFGQSLDYTADDISVYLNGILLVANTDYQAANTTSIWLVNPATADDTLQVQAFNATSIVNVTADVIANSATTSATTAHTIDSFPATTWRSAKYIVQMTSGSDYHATEALVLHDGTSAYVTEYGTIYTNASLGTVDADINTGNVRLLVTPTNATTEVKVVRTGVAV